MRFIITFLVCVAMVYKNFQAFRIIFDGGQTFSMFVPILLILLFDKPFSSKGLIWAFIYMITCYWLFINGVDYFEGSVSTYISIIFSICCLEHYLKSKDENFAKWVLISFIGSYAIMAAISIPQFYLFPEMTRKLLFAEHDGYRVSSDFYWSLSYASLQECFLVIVPLLVLLKNDIKKKWKVCVFLMFVVIELCLLLGDATTPLLFSVLLCVCFLIYKKDVSVLQNMKRLILYGSLSLILLNKYTLIFIFSSIQPIFEGTTNYMKVKDTITFLQTGVVDESSNMGQRDIVYGRSGDVFFSHPFGIETNGKLLGHHSFLLDHLAAMGLLFIIPLLIMIFIRYKETQRYMYKYKFVYLMSYFTFIMMALLKNNFLAIMAFLIVPMALIYIERNKPFEKLNN